MYSNKQRARTSLKMSQEQKILQNLHKSMKAKVIMKKYGNGKSTMTGIKNKSAERTCFISNGNILRNANVMIL